MQKRSITPLSLLFASVSAILGSGWLFSAYLTAEIAGPAALVAWLLGGVLMMGIAFVFAEMCAMLPITGSSTRIPHFTHGSLVSFLFAWMIWLAYLSLTPTEVQAVIQYSSFYFPMLTHPQGGLTHYGYATATVLMLAISLLNTYSLRWLIRCNNILTALKIFIPLILTLSIIVLFAHGHSALHPNHSPFSPFGWHGISGALATGGIVFAFNGFKQAAEMAGEATNPKRALPFAIIGSVGITLIIFLLLEFAFLYSLTPGNLVHGWHHITLENNNSPLTSIALQDHLNALLPLLYIGAIISPLAAGLMYCGSASRSLYAMSKNGYIPSFFKQLTAEGNPMYAIVINFIVGMCMFAPLPGWQSMMAFLTSLMAITYAIAPICLLALRRQAPDFERPFRLPFATVWCTLAFYICTLLVYWSGWDIIFKTDIGIIVGFVVLFLYQAFGKNPNKVKLDWQAGIWIWPYFLGLSVVSYFGNYDGGVGIFNDWQAAVLLAILAVICLYIATRFALPAKRVALTLSKLDLKRYDLMEGG